MISGVEREPAAGSSFRIAFIVSTLVILVVLVGTGARRSGARRDLGEDPSPPDRPWARWQHSGVGAGTGSFAANPLFVGSPNFRITENSPDRRASGVLYAS